MTDPVSRTVAGVPAISDGLAGLLDLDPADRAQAEILMAAAHSPEVRAALGVLRQRLGTFPVHPPETELAPEVWICALLLSRAPALTAGFDRCSWCGRAPPVVAINNGHCTLPVALES